MAEHPPEGAVAAMAAVSDIPPLDRLLSADALRAALDTPVSYTHLTLPTTPYV